MSELVLQKPFEFEAENDKSGIEQIILRLGDCFVFKVPPLRSASGHRAESWDLEKPLFIGFLRVYQNDKQLFVRIYFNFERFFISSDNRRSFRSKTCKLRRNENMGSGYRDGIRMMVFL